MPDAIDELACPKCGSRDNLVISGLDVFALLNRYATDEQNECQWAVKCWGENCGKPTYHINGAARDELFGTGWRDASKKEDPDA